MSLLHLRHVEVLLKLLETKARKYRMGLNKLHLLSMRLLLLWSLLRRLHRLMLRLLSRGNTNRR